MAAWTGASQFTSLKLVFLSMMVRITYITDAFLKPNKDQGSEKLRAYMFPAKMLAGFLPGLGEAASPFCQETPGAP